MNLSLFTITQARLMKLLLINSVLLLCFFMQSIHGAEFKDGVIHLSQQEFLEKISEENVVVIDVRTVKEYQDGHIEGAINYPHRSLLKDSSLLNKYQGKDLIFYCHTGVRAKKVTDYLLRSKTEDARLFHLKGDMRAWRARGLPIVKVK